MTDRMMAALRGLALAGGLVGFIGFVGCDVQEGPVEEAGEAVDAAGANASDALDTDGPVENAVEDTTTP